MKIHAIIPAGGFGRRLWPLSTPQTPKFLRSIGSRKTLAQLTAQRLEPVAQSLTFITGSAHAPALFSQVSDLDEVAVVVEPSPRDSMAAIGLGAALLEARHGGCVVGSFAADHLIRDEAAFRSCVEVAMAGAEEGYLVTIGITPEQAATAYGYIQLGSRLEVEAANTPADHTPAVGLFGVKMFKEKPDQETATAYLQQGGYLWNAGMFVVRSDVLLDSLEQQVPGSGQALRELAQGWDSWDTAARQAAWEKVVRAPIDTVLAEPLAQQGRVAVVPTPAGIGWSDVGDWEAVYQVYRDPTTATPGPRPGSKPPLDATSTPAPPLNLDPGVALYTQDSPGALVHCPGLEGVAVVGVPQAVVVLQDGKLLVTTRENAQKVKDAAVATDEWPAQGLA